MEYPDPLVAALPARWGGRHAHDASPRPDGARDRLTDDMLLAGFGARDPEVARAFVLRFQTAVFGTAVAILADRGLAEDVAQESFVRAWQHAEQYDPRRGTVRSWLLTVVRNLAVDALRVRRPRPVDQRDLEQLLAAISETPERLSLIHEVDTRLQQALAGLPAAQGRAVVLTAVHGMTAAELADFEGVPLGTAKSRIRAGLGKLHDAVAGSGNRCSS